MKISNEKPPQKVWDGCHKYFTIDDRFTIYTYGDTIYNPAGIECDRFLIAHESVHERQQAKYPGGPDAWWDRYFADATFRQDQEVEAYREQYKEYAKAQPDRNKRFKYLHILATNLAGPTYKAGLSVIVAMRMIKE